MENIFMNWLPYSLALIMGISMLIYAILDGYDLGVGMLIDNASSHEKDQMIASIGPFWDANETWLMLGLGLLLVAFPIANGLILANLSIPIAIMVFGLLLRGVAFEFRTKVPFQQKWRWDNRYFYGSLIATLAQGYILGSYLIGFDTSLLGVMFSLLITILLVCAYSLVGACWLIMKCKGGVQQKAIKWAKYHLVNSVIGWSMVFAAIPLISERIYEKWFSFPSMLWMMPVPLLTGAMIIWLYLFLRRMPLAESRLNFLPFVMTIGIYGFNFCGLAYSFFPYIGPENKTIIESAASPDAQVIILVSVLIVQPLLLGYTALSHFIFRKQPLEIMCYGLRA